MAAQGVGETAQAEGQLTGVLADLRAVAENYPQLRATENFQQLMRASSPSSRTRSRPRGGSTTRTSSPTTRRSSSSRTRSSPTRAASRRGSSSRSRTRPSGRAGRSASASRRRRRQPAAPAEQPAPPAPPRLPRSRHAGVTGRRVLSRNGAHQPPAPPALLGERSPHSVPPAAGYRSATPARCGPGRRRRGSVRTRCALLERLAQGLEGGRAGVELVELEGARESALQ